MSFSFTHFSPLEWYPLPEQEIKEAAGYDLPIYAPFDKKYILQPGQTARLPTNIALNLSAGYRGRIVPRSSISTTLSIFPGVIDSDYRKEIKVVVTNKSLTPVEISHKECVAQLLFEKCPDLVDLTMREGQQQLKTTRIGGFGSTNTKWVPLVYKGAKCSFYIF